MNAFIALLEYLLGYGFLNSLALLRRPCQGCWFVLAIAVQNCRKVSHYMAVFLRSRTEIIGINQPLMLPRLRKVLWSATLMLQKCLSYFDITSVQATIHSLMQQKVMYMGMSGDCGLSLWMRLRFWLWKHHLNVKVLILFVWTFFPFC